MFPAKTNPTMQPQPFTLGPHFLPSLPQTFFPNKEFDSLFPQFPKFKKVNKGKMKYVLVSGGSLTTFPLRVKEFFFGTVA